MLSSKLKFGVRLLLLLLKREKNGVKYLPVRQDLFDQTVDAKGMRTKDSTEAVRAFETMITEKIVSSRLGLTRGQNLLGNIKTL